MPIKVKAPGSCGELVQGSIDGINFLITCPIDWYSEAQVAPFSTNEELRPKTAAAVKQTLKYLGISQQVNIKINSNLPHGKGMASSSADISAACQAAAIMTAKRQLSPAEIADIALSIEPTDAIFYPGITMFDHIHGKIRRFLGTAPPMYIAIFDIAPQNGVIDTLRFNTRQDLPLLNKAKEKKIVLAVEMLKEGLVKQSAKLIGNAATISALANQDILYKPHLEKIIFTAHSHNAVGVCAAHSGTVLGVLFDAHIMNEHENALKSICRLGGEIRHLKTVRLIAGGLIIEGDSESG